MFCRLCGVEKSDAELVISLTENVGIITFKDLFEYFSRIELDNNSDMPQKICKSCKNSVVNFSEFVCNVAEQEQKLKTTFKPCDLPCEVKVEHDVNENFQADQPNEKRQRLDETFEEKFLDKVASPIDEPESSVARTTAKQHEDEILQHGTKASFSYLISIDT